MRKAMIYILMLLLGITSGCSSFGAKDSDKAANADAYVFGQDNQYYFESTMAESETGYYFFSGPECSYLYYMDKNTMKAQVLCNKPDCLHENEQDPKKIKYCNAYFGITTKALIYYDNTLYLLDSFSTDNSGYGLYKVSLDGAQRKKIYTFKERPIWMIIHRGYIYYTVSNLDAALESSPPKDETTIDLGELDKIKTKTVLYRIQISDLGKKPEMLYKVDGYSTYLGRMIGYKTSIYFSYSYYQESDLKNKIGSIMEYSITNGEITEIKRGAGCYSISGGYLVYYYPEKDGMKKYRCCMDGSNDVLLDKLPGMPINSENYIITDTDFDKSFDNSIKRQLIIYDLNGNKLAAADIDCFDSDIETYGGRGNTIFLQGSSGENEYGTINAVWTIDLNDIKTGTLTPKKVFEFVPKVEDNGVVTKIGS
jgi:hypothetical protein